MSLLPSLPRAMAELLVPDGSTLDACWVVCLGDRQQIATHDGRPVYGDVTSWSPILPLATYDAAREFGERMGVASLGTEPTLWDWYPVGDDCPELLELYGVSDGHEDRTEVAIVPLLTLVSDGAE